MADDSYVKEKQVRDLTTTMIGVVNGIELQPGVPGPAGPPGEAGVSVVPSPTYTHALRISFPTYLSPAPNVVRLPIGE